MTTLYRSPNVIIDRFEWHISVTQKNQRGKTTAKVQHYFRPLSTRLYRWAPITAWKGPKPRAIWQSRLRKFRLHAELALRSEELRQWAIAHPPRHNAKSLANWAEAA